ncbi:PREDICTED: flap endonuclease GEN-like 1 [Fragaria vesca subsp. vesca]|uniref:flap endonuclease GEN-like 1 n=1 Tax=Fragaria vesca subsp. vesca TaxID=101020 RepID=UPI0002C2EBA2|nr:PREDICTED: flap endonuclease GEN-like 1 [Fragaria vesca subsp. vesca]
MFNPSIIYPHCETPKKPIRGGGKFWDLLKPYARHEGFDFLRDKRVAVDLSFWIVQHETAIKARARSPHLRLTFFRTINLFAKFGAFPVFVVDGNPSHLKSQARIARFFRVSGIDSSSLPVAGDGISAERNSTFTKHVQECVELLELLGVPVLKAKGEAEALCGQLNLEGDVDACITSDSDALLFGAKCVIKSFQSNSKEPFECYYMSDIEAGLGLKRKHMIAISLLVGNDHDLNGVQGIGLDTALRFVQTFSEDEILNRLRDIGNGHAALLQGGIQYVDDIVPSLAESSSKTKFSHCSFCGHPGSKKAHSKSSCEYCITNIGEGCMKKPEGFRCSCSSCNMDRKDKEQKKQENWRLKVLNKIAQEPNFPNEEIIEIYLCNNHGYFSANEGPCISWESPKTEALVDFLAFHQLWEPSYIRQRMLPMLSTIYLREMAENPLYSLLYGQYEFHSIDRLKIRNGHQFYVVKWKRAVPTVNSVTLANPEEESDILQDDVIEVDESISVWDESDDPKIRNSDGCYFMLTDENMDLVQAAFPEEVDRFLQEKELKELKRRKASVMPETPPKPKGVQLNITEFYRSTKTKKLETEAGEDPTQISVSQNAETSNRKRKASNSNIPKSVRRRLLFD